MALTIHTKAVPHPPILVDFGWYFDIGQRNPEYTYQSGTGVNYPPSHDTLASPVTLPSAGTTFTLTVHSTATFEAPMRPSNTLVLNDGTHHVEITYAGSTSTTFTGCLCRTAGLTFASGTPIWDKRFYVDSLPLKHTVTFDAQDRLNLGLPTTYIPAGVTVTTYEWDFDNGLSGVGSYATTTFPYAAAPPSMQAKLVVTDLFDREFSCAKRINLKSLIASGGSATREGG